LIDRILEEARQGFDGCPLCKVEVIPIKGTCFRPEHGVALCDRKTGATRGNQCLIRASVRSRKYCEIL
jgi:hypothetical protein